jgi:hypothetical protein
MKIYLATWLLEASQGVSLTKVNGNQRLISYYHTRDKLKEFTHYCKTGMNPVKPK